MRRLGLTVALAGLAFLGAGCGAAKRADPYAPYTVKQVAEAFAAEGIALVRNPGLAGPPGTVMLHRGDKPPHMVVALVNVSGGAGPGRHYLGTGYHLRRRGNVLVYFTSTNARPAAAALARLH